MSDSNLKYVTTVKDSDKITDSLGISEERRITIYDHICKLLQAGKTVSGDLELLSRIYGDNLNEASYAFFLYGLQSRVIRMAEKLVQGMPCTFIIAEAADILNLHTFKISKS